MTQRCDHRVSHGLQAFQISQTSSPLGSKFAGSIFLDVVSDKFFLSLTIACRRMARPVQAYGTGFSPSECDEKCVLFSDCHSHVSERLKEFRLFAYRTTTSSDSLELMCNSG